jgi:pimeloyl-ACP methyl ester carboxylesterase
MVDVKPFLVAVSAEEQQFLKARLHTARFPDTLDNIAPWEDGTDLTYFEAFVQYWLNEYDWPKWEAKLNSLQQFTATVSGINVHFVHERSNKPDAVPLLLMHGWPGSYFEFHKLIPILKADGRFHIVAPSLPGYGFSSPAKERGCGVTAIASCMDSLMATLGYNHYIAQGGDWGAIICRALAKYHSSTCAAIHINMCLARPSLSNPFHLLQLANVALFPRLPLFLNASEIQNCQEMYRFEQFETGYQKIQGTKPQTLAYALQDSPTGLAAWILEKFKTWSDCGQVPDNVLTKDELLTNICIYWFGGRIASSMRLYKETLSNTTELNSLITGYCNTPTGVALFPKELYRPPKSWAAAAYNLQHWTVMQQGGHFAAFEQPELLANDLFKFTDLAVSRKWL